MQNILQLQDDLKNFSEQQLVREMQMPSGQVPQFLVLSELGRRKRIKADFSRQEAAGAPTVAEETVAAAGMPQAAATGIAQSMAPKTSMAENTGIGAMMPKQPTRMASGGVVKMQTGGLPEREVLQRIINTLTNARPSEKAALRRQLVEAVGEDTVREAESMMLRDNASLGAITQMRMEKQGIFGNSPGRPQLAPEKPTFLPPPESTRQRGDVETGQLTSILASDPITKALAQKSGVSVADYISGMDPNTRAQELLRVSGERATTFDKDKDGAAYASFVDTPSNYNIDSQVPTQADLDLKNVSDTRNEAVGIGTSDNPISVDLTQDVIPAAPTPAGLPARPTSLTAPTLGTLGSPDNLRAEAIRQIGGLETIQPPSEASTMETAAGTEQTELLSGLVTGLTPGQKFQSESLNPLNIGPTELNQPAVRNALQGPDSAGLATALKNAAESGPQELTGTEQMAAFLEQENFGPQLDPVAQAREDEINSLLAVFDDPNRTEAQVKAARQRLSQIGAKDRAIAAATETLEGIGGAVKNRIASDAADIYGTLGTGANLLGSTDTAAALFEAQKEAEAKVTPSKTEAETVVSNVPEGIGLNLSGTTAVKGDTGTVGAGDLPLSLGDTATRDIGAPNTKVKINDRTISPTTTSTSTAANIGGAGGMGGIEGQLADMLKSMDKSREQDKWLALANTGLALMASKQPTLGGALGEAGMAGMKQLREGKKQYSKDKLAIMALQQRIDAAKLAASSRASASNAALARLGLSIDKENRLASQAEMDRALDKLNALGGVERIRMLQNADDLSIAESQELLTLQGLYDTVFGGNAGAKAVNVAG